MSSGPDPFLIGLKRSAPNILGGFKDKRKNLIKYNSNWVDWS